MMMFILPMSPCSSWLPESGTTVIDNSGTPRFMVALCCSTKLPLRPFSVPVTLCLSKTRKDLSGRELYFLPTLSMQISLAALLVALRSIIRSRGDLQLENLALRHQICVLRRSSKRRPKLTSGDRFFWVCLFRLSRDWRSTLVIVKPETVVAWHRKGFRLFWTWKVRRGQPGRPVVTRETRDLIRKMCRENPGWGAPRIHGELLKLGIDIGETSVSKYMVRYRKPPSQTWRTFLENHVSQLVSVDFFHCSYNPFPGPLRVSPFEDRGSGYHFAILSRHQPATLKVATHPIWRRYTAPRSPTGRRKGRCASAVGTDLCST